MQNKDKLIKELTLLKKGNSSVTAIYIFFMKFFSGIRTVEAYTLFLTVVYLVLGLKAGKEWFEKGADKYLVISKGNDKIGTDTLICDVSCAIDCHCRLCGYCDLTDKCYALSLETFRYYKLLKNVLSALRWLKLSFEEKIASFEHYMDYEIEFIRFNGYGDFFDLDSYIEAFKIAEYMYNKYGIISYFYTHNKDIEAYYLDNHQDIHWFVCNFSYKEAKSHKKAIAVKITDLHKYLNNDKYIVCNGDCLKCPYCKDNDLKKTVIFVMHGNGQNAEKLIVQYYGLATLRALQRQKRRDYLLFEQKIDSYAYA